MNDERRAELLAEIQVVRDAIASAGTDKHAAAFELASARDDDEHGGAAKRYSRARQDLESLKTRLAELEAELAPPR